jgi:hypothetical protein
MHTQLFLPPVAACAAALHPASARPPESAEELQRPGGLAKGLAHLQDVVLEHGLDSVESEEDTVVDVLYQFYLRHRPEYGNDARTRCNLRASIQCHIAELQRLSRAKLTQAERDEVAQVTSVFAEQMCLEHMATRELALYADRTDHMQAWSDVTNRKFEVTMRYCSGEESQEQFELERARLRRKHANCGVCGGFAQQRCGRCKRAGVDCYYCSAECARCDWQEHRLVCGQVR